MKGQQRRFETGRARTRIDASEDGPTPQPPAEKILKSPLPPVGISRFTRIAKWASRIAVAAVEACNHRIDDNAGMFIPTPKMQGAVDRADAAARAVNQIYLDTVATPDLPDNVLIHVLRV